MLKGILLSSMKSHFWGVEGDEMLMRAKKTEIARRHFGLNLGGLKVLLDWDWGREKGRVIG